MSGSAQREASGRVSVLAAVCLAALVLPLSFSAGAVATPAIGGDLGGSVVALNWVTNAFMLSFGSCLMSVGVLADQVGRKRVFSVGVASFVVLSVALSCARNVLMIDALRALQGFAAAAALSGGTAALAQEFDGRARTKAFSLLGTTFGVGLAFGPLLAGFLIDKVNWRYVFLSSAVVGVLALLFGVPRMRETRDPQARDLDWPGTITFTAALSLFTYGVILSGERGWSNRAVIAALSGSVVFLAAFIYVELRVVARPMLDLSLFRYSRFVGVQTLPIATCYCYVVLLVLLPLRFIGVDELSGIQAGVLMIALSGPMLIVPALAALLTRWLSPAIVSGVGLLIAAGGLAWLSLTPAGGVARHMVLPLALIGVGAGLPWGLMDGLSVSVVPKERAGMATGIFSTVRVAGEGIALAMVSAVLTVLTESNLHHRLVGSAPAFAVASREFEAAQRLATGDLKRARTLVPEASRVVLLDSYNEGFRTVLQVLSVTTTFSALVVFVLLRRCGSAARTAGQPDKIDSEECSA